MTSPDSLLDSVVPKLSELRVSATGTNEGVRIMANSDNLNLGDVLQGVSGADADNVVAYLPFSYDAATNATTVSVTSQANPLAQ